MFIKRIRDFIVTVEGDIVDNCHPVNIIHLNKDNSYIERNIYFNGSIDTFKNMSEIQLIVLLGGLINLTENSKFGLELETMYAIK